MSETQYVESAHQRLAHIKKHVELGYDVPSLVANIENGRGNPIASARLLQSHATMNAMHSWFTYASLEGLKSWEFVAGKLEQWVQQRKPDTGSGGWKTPDYSEVCSCIIVESMGANG